MPSMPIRIKSRPGRGLKISNLVRRKVKGRGAHCHQVLPSIGNSVPGLAFTWIQRAESSFSKPPVFRQMEMNTGGGIAI